jgi:hypothetical protein
MEGSGHVVEGISLAVPSAEHTPCLGAVGIVVSGTDPGFLGRGCKL